MFFVNKRCCLGALLAVGLITNGPAVLESDAQPPGALNVGFRDEAGKSVVKLPSPAIESGLNIYVRGKELFVSPGSCWINDKRVEILQEVGFEIKPSRKESVINEPLVLSDDSLQGQLSKTILSQCQAWAKDPVALSRLLVVGTVKVKSSRGSDAVVYRKGIDFVLDEQWGAIGRTSTGAIKKGQIVYVDYQVWKCRLDTLVLDELGQFKTFKGPESRSAPPPAQIPESSLPLTNIYVSAGAQVVLPDAILPITNLQSLPCSQKQKLLNRQALAKTVTKLQNSTPVTIVFWGDSITGGADATSVSSSFPNVFISRLQSKFPNSRITPVNLGIGGTNTKGRLPGFETDVLALKPDLIVIEFVNDLLLSSGELEANYSQVLLGAKQAGAEVILVTPHFPNPALLGGKDWALAGQRPYIKMLRRLAQDGSVVLADVALRWEHLDRQGLRPDLLLVDQLIHPSDFGHEIYADELVKCFE